MSPEQTRGLPNIGPATDVWALGLIAYRTLAGRIYWTAPTIAVLMSEILALPMDPPSSRAKWLPAGFDAWFARSCARDSAEQFATVGEQVASLSLALGVTMSPFSNPNRTSQHDALSNSSPPLTHPNPSSSGMDQPRWAPPAALFTTPLTGPSQGGASSPKVNVTHGGLSNTTTDALPVKSQWPIAITAGAAVAVALLGGLVIFGMHKSPAPAPSPAPLVATAPAPATTEIPQPTPLPTPELSPRAHLRRPRPRASWFTLRRSPRSLRRSFARLPKRCRLLPRRRRPERCTRRPL